MEARALLHPSVKLAAHIQRLAVTAPRSKLKEMEDVPGSGTQVTREYECGAILTNMLLRPGSGTLYSASDKGWVRCYKYPLTGDSVTYKVRAGCPSLAWLVLYAC